GGGGGVRGAAPTAWAGGGGADARRPNPLCLGLADLFRGLVLVGRGLVLVGRGLVGRGLVGRRLVLERPQGHRGRSEDQARQQSDAGALHHQAFFSISWRNKGSGPPPDTFKWAGTERFVDLTQLCPTWAVW